MIKFFLTDNQVNTIAAAEDYNPKRYFQSHAKPPERDRVFISDPSHRSMSHQHTDKDKEEGEYCERPQKPHPLKSDQERQHQPQSNKQNRSHPLPRENINVRRRRSVRRSIILR